MSNGLVKSTISCTGFDSSPRLGLAFLFLLKNECSGISGVTKSQLSLFVRVFPKIRKRTNCGRGLVSCANSLFGRQLFILSGSPSFALLPTFLGEGSPTKIDYRHRGTLILTSLLEDLVVLDCYCVRSLDINFLGEIKVFSSKPHKKWSTFCRGVVAAAKYFLPSECPSPT